MRTLYLAAAALIMATPAAAQSMDNPPTWTIQCIEVAGRSAPAVCRVPGSRVDQREDICTCPDGGQRVEVPICAKGVRPPPENLALERFRSKAARDGSLMGDMFEGRQVCVAPRGPPTR